METQSGPEVLGEPMGLKDVAKLVGCSVWTVRQELLRDGLPHVRSNPNGRIVCYRQQVVRWILRRQEIHNKR